MTPFFWIVPFSDNSLQSGLSLSFHLSKQPLCSEPQKSAPPWTFLLSCVRRVFPVCHPFSLLLVRTGADGAQVATSHLDTSFLLFFFDLFGFSPT